jgi:hypothetical protein
MEAGFTPLLNYSVKIDHIRFYGNCVYRVDDRQPGLLTSRYRRRELRLSSMPKTYPLLIWSVGPSRYAADSRIKHSISPRATGCKAKDA